MVRSGLVEPKEYREMLAATIGSLVHQQRPTVATAGKTRRWPLICCAGTAPNWNDLRRGQDYYFEGALIWLEADAVIRERFGREEEPG